MYQVISYGLRRSIKKSFLFLFVSGTRQEAIFFLSIQLGSGRLSCDTEVVGFPALNIHWQFGIQYSLSLSAAFCNFSLLLIIICSVIIAIGIGTHGYFVGKGVKESQPWHHLSDPLGLLRSIEIPLSLNLGFKAEQAENGKGLTSSS